MSAQPAIRPLREQHLRSRVEALIPKLRALVARFDIPAAEGERIVERTLRLYIQKEPSVQNDDIWATCVARANCLHYLRSIASTNAEGDGSQAKPVSQSPRPRGLTRWIGAVGTIAGKDKSWS